MCISVSYSCSIGILWGGEKERKSVGHISAGMSPNFLIDSSFNQRCFSDLYHLHSKFVLKFNMLKPLQVGFSETFKLS